MTTPSVCGGSSPVPIPATEVHTVFSEHVGTEFQVWIAHPVPGIMPFPPGPRRVLYVLDANLFFGTAVEMTRTFLPLITPLFWLQHALGRADGRTKGDSERRNADSDGWRLQQLDLCLA